MMIRNFLRCRGCGGNFVARVAATSTDFTRFYVPCPHCHLPIRATAAGQGPTDHRIQFDCDVIPPEVTEGAPVVTINPYVPARYDADSDEPVGAFSAITLSHLLGEYVLDYFGEEGSAQEAIDNGWPRVQRLYEYYLAEDWPNFDRVGAESFENWRPITTLQERTAVANQILAIFGERIGGELSEPAEQFVGSYLRKHTAALHELSYVEYLRQEGDAGELRALQRSIFDLIGLFVTRFEMWKAGRLPRWIQDPSALDELTLFRDEFPEVRDLYQQAFEVICKTLRYPIAAQNTVKRKDPHSFGDDHPDPNVVPINQRPSNLRRFERLPNAHKVAYFALVPRWNAVGGVLENRVRNTIGHATARHDLRTGRIVNNADFAGLSYLDFLAKVFDIFELLCLALQVVKTARVASSPDPQPDVFDPSLLELEVDRVQ